jgi:hypothetical protein
LQKDERVGEVVERGLVGVSRMYGLGVLGSCRKLEKARGDDRPSQGVEGGCRRLLGVVWVIRK